MLTSFPSNMIIALPLCSFYAISLLFISNANFRNAAAAITSVIHHGNIVESAPNHIPQHSHDSLPQVVIRLNTTLPIGSMETSITLYPTKLSSFTISKGVTFLPHEWGVWAAEVLDGPFMAKWREEQADRLLRRSAPKGLGTVEEATQKVEEGTVDYENEEREELDDDDYKEGEKLVCFAAGFQRMKYELDFALRDSWGAAIWEVECWVPRKGKLKKWWESLWSR